MRNKEKVLFLPKKWENLYHENRFLAGTANPGGNITLMKMTWELKKVQYLMKSCGG